MLDEKEELKFLQDLENNSELETALSDIEKITLSLRQLQQVEPPEQIFNKNLLTNLNFNKPKFYFNPRQAAQIAAAFIIFCAVASGLNSIVNRPASPPPELRLESAGGDIGTARFSDDEAARNGASPYAFDAKTSDANLYIRRFTIHLTVKDLDDAVSKLNELGGEAVNSEYNLSGEYGDAYISRKIDLNSYWNYVERLKTLGETTYSGETAELATARILDPEAKIAARRAQYTRLNNILSQITTVKDLNNLERAMIDLEMEIASINSTIYAFNESVLRPVVDVYLNESPAPPALFARNFGEKLSEDFRSSFIKTVNGFKEFFIFIAGSFFQILVGVIIIAAIVIFRKGRKK
jgi:hypothetical protein